MKLLVIIAALSLLTTAAVSAQQNITLSWTTTVSVPSLTNVVWKIYNAPTASTAVTNFTLIKTVPGTNLATVLTTTPGESYYYVSASNTFWGIQFPPSNVVGTPSASDPSGVLSVTRGP